MSKRYTNYVPSDVDRRRNPIRLSVEGVYLSPEHYIMVKSKCEKFVEDLLATFDGVELEFSEEIFTSIETEKAIRGECGEY